MQASAAVAERLASHFSDDAVRSLIIERRVELARGLFAGMEDSILNRRDLETALGQGRISPKEFRIILGRTFVDLAMMRVVVDRQIDLPVLEQLLAQGASVVFNKLNMVFPELGALAAGLAKRFESPVEITAVMSFDDRSGIEPHHDTHNLFIVQLEGDKTWRLLGDPVEPGMHHDQFKGPEGEAREFVLRPGDAMFLPAGQRHVCTASLGNSVHVAFLLQHPEASMAVAVLANAILEDSRMKAPFLPFLGGEARTEALERYRARLHELVDELDLEGILDAKGRRGTPAPFSFPERRAAK